MLKKLTEILKGVKDSLSRKLVTVHFYMKSGNVIVADRVDSKFTVDVRGDDVVGIRKWQQFSPRNQLMLVALNLSQIEAIIIS